MFQVFMQSYLIFSIQTKLYQLSLLKQKKWSLLFTNVEIFLWVTFKLIFSIVKMNLLQITSCIFVVKSYYPITYIYVVKLLWPFIVYHFLFPRNVVKSLTQSHSDTEHICVFYMDAQEATVWISVRCEPFSAAFLRCVCYLLYRFRWGLHNQWCGTTAWSVLLMPYRIHGYMKVDWQKQRERSRLSGCLLFPDIPPRRSCSWAEWESLEEMPKKSCSLKNAGKYTF